MATEVGTAYVAIIPSAKGFARNLQKDIAKEFAGSNLDKAIAEALGGGKPFKLPVQPDLDPKAVPDKVSVPRGKEPKLPVELDPLVREFQAQVKREMSALTREVSAEIPITPETAQLRSELAAEISKIERELKAEIPTEPAGRREYEAKLRALTDDVHRRVKATIRVEPEVDRDQVRSVLGRLMDFAGDLVQGLASSAAKGLNQLAVKFGIDVASSFSTVATTGGAMTVATGGINLLVGALIAVSSAAVVALTGFVALAPAVLIAGGAFGSLFTIVAGGAGTMAVFKLGLSGIGDALGEIGKDGKVSEETLARLSPNARSLVKELEKLKGPLDNLRRFVQDRLLAGMNTQVRDLAAKWLPALKPMLGDLATRFNGFAKKVFDALGKPEFIKNIQSAMSGFGHAVDRVGDSMGPLIDAFGRLAKASAPFLEELGDMIGDVVDKFSAWIKSADKSGKLDTFMKDAAKALRDIWDIGGLVFGIIGDVVEILFPSSKRTADGVLGGVKGFLQDIKTWLGDPENQKKLKDFIDKIQDFIVKATTEWIPAVIDFMNKVDGWVKKVKEWGDKISEWRDKVSAAFAVIRDKVSAGMGAVRGALESAGRAVSSAVGHFNRLRDGVSDRVRSVAATMRALPGRIRSALGNLGSLLYQAGRNVVQGLIDGMRSRMPGLHGVGSAVAQVISDYLPHSPAKRGPLSGSGSPYDSGQSIVKLLASGVTSTLGAAESAASDLAGTFALASSPTSGMSLPAGGATPAPGRLVAEWVGGDGDPIMSAIRQHTRIYYSGSAQAAFGTGR